MHLTSSLRFEVHLTYDCNLACKHCNRGIGLTSAKHTPDLTVEMYRQWLDELPDMLKRKRYLHIVFTGGEPTLFDIEPYVLETIKVAPKAQIAIATNEFTEEARKQLAYLAAEYGVTNQGSAKPEGGPTYEFLEGMFLSPADVGVERTAPCKWSVQCGISVDATGMTGCSMGGSVDGILGLGLRTRRFEELSDKRLMDMCKHCGAWLVDASKVDPAKYITWKGQPISKEWREGLMRLAAKDNLLRLLKDKEIA